MAHMPSASGQSLDTFLRQQFDVLQYIRDNMEAILKVANHCTPVEDLLDFQTQVEALYANLGALIEASTLILSASDAGIALLTAVDVPAQRAALGLGTVATMDASEFASASDFTTLQQLIDALTDVVNDTAAAVNNVINSAEFQALVARMDDLEDQFETKVNQLIQTMWDGGLHATIDLQLVNLNNALGDLSGQLDIDRAQNQLTAETVANQGLVIQNHSESLSSLNVQLGNVVDDVTIINDTVTGVAARMTTAEGELLAQGEAVDSLTVRITNNESLSQLAMAASTQLSGELAATNSSLAAEVLARQDLATTITEQGDSLTAMSESITAVQASITGSGNLLPNAGFEIDTGGWSIFTVGTGWESPTISKTQVTASKFAAMQMLNGNPATVPTGATGAKSPIIPIENQKEYIVSAWLAAINVTARLEYRVLDVNDNMVAQGNVGQSTYPISSQLVDMVRHHVRIPIPFTGTQLQLRLWADNPTGVQPKVWLIRPMAEEASEGQINPSPWISPNVGIELAAAAATETLRALVEQQGDDITALAENTTDLSARVDTAESALINEMITRASQNEAMSQVMTTLSNQLGTVEDNYYAQSTAVANLQTSVGTINGTLASQGSSITSLQASLSSLPTVYLQDDMPAGTSYNVSDIWYDTNDGNKQYFWNGSFWDTSSTISGAIIYHQDAMPTGGSYNIGDLWFDKDDGNKPYRWNGGSWVDISDARITGTATALNSLTNRVTTAEGNITAQATSITNLTATVGTKASASALSALDVRVGTTESGLTTMKASYTLTLDVNNYVSGIRSVNNGDFADFTVITNRFAVVAPGQAKQTPFVVSSVGGVSKVGINGALLVDGSITASSLTVGSLSDVSSNMGTITAGKLVLASGGRYVILEAGGTYPIWFGTSSVANEASALFYAKNDGSLYYKGALRGSNFDMRSTVISTGGGREAPFIISDQSNAGSSSGGTTLTCNFAPINSPDYGSGYSRTRVAARKMDVSLFANASGAGGAGQTTGIHFEVQYDGGAWTRFGTNIFDVYGNSSESLAMRYTLRDDYAWNTVAFRVVSGGITHALTATMQIFNFQPSPFDGGSYSNPDTGGSAAIPASGAGGSGGGGGGWCVTPWMYVTQELQATHLQKGEPYPTWFPGEEVQLRPLVGRDSAKLVECVRITTLGGGVWEGSMDTPFNLRNATKDLEDGKWKYAHQMKGEYVMVDADGEIFWEPVMEVSSLGLQWVVPLSFAGASFPAGKYPNYRIFSHNMAKPVEP